MNIYVIWGFLGSGKTTLINHLLFFVFSRHKVVIIENESGKESIDGDFLRSKNYQVKDLKSGCICCSLRAELPACIQEIKHSVQPDILLIEPSGLASLEELLQMRQLSIDVLVTLVDVLNYPLLMQLNASFYNRQYALSPIIILTKTDLISEDLVKDVSNQLRHVSPAAEIVNGYEALTEDSWNEMFEAKKLQSGWRRVSPTPSLKSPIQSQPYTLSVNAPLDSNFFANNFNRLNNELYVIRAKGFLKTIDGSIQKLDYVNGLLSLEAMPLSFHLENCTLSVWAENEFPDLEKKRINYFLNASEIHCSINSIRLECSELFRYMGYGEAVPDIYITQFIIALKEEAVSICKPRFGFRLQSGEKISTSSIRIGDLIFNPGPIISKCLEGSEFYAIIVASVGVELDKWIKSKHESGDVMAAFIADAIGSAIVESIMSWGIHFISSEMALYNLSISNSYSPGYCGWNITEQQHFFSLLPKLFCDVHLTSSSLMLPIKSVSTVIGIGETIEKKPYGCAICRKKDCYKRERREEVLSE